jgi:hypothetical protein
MRSSKTCPERPACPAASASVKAVLSTRGGVQSRLTERTAGAEVRLAASTATHRKAWTLSGESGTDTEKRPSAAATEEAIPAPPSTLTREPGSARPETVTDPAPGVSHRVEHRVAAAPCAPS